MQGHIRNHHFKCEGRNVFHPINQFPLSTLILSHCLVSCDFSASLQLYHQQASSLYCSLFCHMNWKWSNCGKGCGRNMQMLASIFTIHIIISFLVASISERNLCCSSPEKGFSWKSASFFHHEHCKKIQSAFLQGSRPCWVLSRMPLLGAFEVL